MLIPPSFIPRPEELPRDPLPEAEELDWSITTDFMPRLQSCSSRALTAFGVACVGWLRWRLSRLHDDPWVDGYLEALWSELAGGESVLRWRPSIRREQGLVAVLARLACVELGVIRRDPDPAARVGSAALLSALVRSVLDERAHSFIAWCDAVLDRLVTLSAASYGDVLTADDLDSRVPLRSGPLVIRAFVELSPVAKLMVAWGGSRERDVYAGAATLASEHYAELTAPPSWIPEPARVHQYPLNFPWDFDDQVESIGEQDGEIAARLAWVSGGAKLGFALACAEWVRWRLRPVLDEPLFDEYIESQWLMLAGYPSVLIWQARFEGPMDLGHSVAEVALGQLSDTYYGMGETREGEWDAALAATLALHVLGEQQAFLRWQDQVLARLEVLHPMEEDRPDGGIVLFEDFDPGMAIVTEREKAARFLISTVNRLGNRFVEG